MRLVVNTGDAPPEEVHLNDAVALAQLESVLLRHRLSGHVITRLDNDAQFAPHYRVETANGVVEYFLSREGA